MTKTVAYRDLKLDLATRSDQERTINGTISTEFAVERWELGGLKEVLEHGKENVDLARAKDGLPLIVSHDNSQTPVGIVENVRLVGRELKALLRFGKSARAKEYWDDVAAGVLRNLSIGYQILRGREDGEYYRVTKWEPYEVSLVSVPADPNSQIGRSMNNERYSVMENENEQDKPTRSQRRAVNRAVEAEQERVNDILAIGDKYGQRDLARRFIADGSSVDDMREAVLGRMGETKPASFEVPDYMDIGLSEREAADFSFVKAIRAQMDPKFAQRHAGFEMEASKAVEKKLGRSAQGLFVPVEVLRRRGKRDLNIGSASAGGDLVGTYHAAENFIEMLRNKIKVMELGATILSDLTENLSIPRQTGAGTAYWTAEGSSPTESEPAFDTVTLSPKSVAAYTDYTRKMLLQASPDVETLVRSDLSSVIAIEIDRVAVYGSGAGAEPTGIQGTTGVSATTFAAADPVYSEIVAMETAIAADNADQGALGYLMDSAMRGALKTTEKATGTAQFVWENASQPGAGMVNGFRAEVSNNITDGDVVFGDWSSLLIGEWSILDLLVDPYTLGTSGGVRVIAFKDIDIAVRHPESFCLSNDGV